MPATSIPTLGSRGARRPMNSRTNPGFGASPSRSARLTDAARTRTRISPSDGTGRSTSRSSTTSGGPYRSRHAAFIGSATPQESERLQDHEPDEDEQADPAHGGQDERHVR